MTEITYPDFSIMKENFLFLQKRKNKMTDLTDKWKKGKIPEAWYYVKDIHNKESLDRYFKETDNFEYLEDWEVDEVLAPVPSYEEWQASENYIDYLKQCISVYESKDKQATETSIAYNELAKENEELKLLVAEAWSHFKASFPCLYKHWIEKADKFLGEDK